jgi:uncharacterized protein DUF3306
VSDPDTEPSAPSPAPEDEKESGFLTRWSRRKRAAEAGQPLAEPAPPPAATTPAELPDPATLGFDDDFTAYLGAQVPAALKRAAMAKLFSDPSFNRMDGLDVYIEDYNLVPDLPAAERDLLAHARELLSPVPTADREAPPPVEKPDIATEPPAPSADGFTAPADTSFPDDKPPTLPKA